MLSSDADARSFPSGENAQPNTALDNSKGYSKLLNQVAVQMLIIAYPVWSLIVLTALPLGACQTRRVASSPPEAMSSPSPAHDQLLQTWASNITVKREVTATHHHGVAIYSCDFCAKIGVPESHSSVV